MVIFNTEKSEKKDFIFGEPIYCDISDYGSLWFIALLFCLPKQLKESPLLFCQFPPFMKKLLVRLLCEPEGTKFCPTTPALPGIRVFIFSLKCFQVPPKADNNWNVQTLLSLIFSASFLFFF